MMPQRRYRCAECGEYTMQRCETPACDAAEAGYPYRCFNPQCPRVRRNYRHRRTCPHRSHRRSPHNSRDYRDPDIEEVTWDDEKGWVNA